MVRSGSCRVTVPLDPWATRAISRVTAQVTGRRAAACLWRRRTGGPGRSSPTQGEVHAPAPASGDEPFVSRPRVVAHFDFAAGGTRENIALEPDGSAGLTSAFARQAANVTRGGDIRRRVPLPAVTHPDTPVVHNAIVLGIARAHDDTLYVTGAGGTGICRPTGCPTTSSSTSTEGCFTRRLGTGDRPARAGDRRTAHRVGRDDGAHPHPVRNRLRRQRDLGPRRRGPGVQHRPWDAAADPRPPKRFRGPGRDPGDRARRHRRLRVHLTPWFSPSGTASRTPSPGASNQV
ncbi:hypothetical protein TUSST3_16810 [Streptomyces sp. TUS-ST3]|nr:hypothetical protein TUSST3_16810 [Streptomyces sp. TUS-ST3]